MLCACYDAFGCADLGKLNGTREGYIQNLANRKGDYFYDGVQGFEQKRQKAVRSFWTLVKTSNVTTAFVAIHGFACSGRDNRWQLHGINGAAQALGGEAFGAAHYTEKMPPIGSKLTLAATVKNQCKQGAACKKEFYVGDKDALVRVFSV